MSAKSRNGIFHDLYELTLTGSNNHHNNRVFIIITDGIINNLTGDIVGIICTSTTGSAVTVR